jgi:hypothetical protein
MRSNWSARKSRSARSDGEDAKIWKPRLFNPSCADDRRLLTRLAKERHVELCESQIAAQIAELVEVRNPSLKGNQGEISRLTAVHLINKHTADFGTWVYYPWSCKLIQVLPKAEFREVRNSRNRYKISKTEQDDLSARRIGIVGLSVGYAVAQVLAMEGCATEFRLADFDRISLSNLNRLPCGIADIGLNKAVNAARKMYEFDPYLDISVFPEGLREENLQRFMLEGGRLDLLIEECDDLYMKVRVRELARSKRVPVIMETNDRGMLDIERFDTEPDRPILHGLLGTFKSDDLKGLTAEEKVPIVIKILGEGRISQRLATSLAEINKSIVSWPQLGSGAMLGGGVAADAARRLLTGEFNVSGRFYVDIHDIVSDSPVAGVVPNMVSEISTLRQEADANEPVADVTSHSMTSEFSDAVIRKIVAAGVLAPSGGNVQPWKFVWTRNTKLRCSLDPTRLSSFLDYDRRAAHLSLGAAVENMCLTALDLGFSPEISAISRQDNTVQCEITLSPSDSKLTGHELLAARAIKERTTNRRLSARVPLDPKDRETLEQVASSRGAQLHLLTGEDELREIGAILGAGDKFRFTCETLYREMISEMRWQPAETAATRDGIDIETLELRKFDKSGMRLLSSWGVVQFLRKTGAISFIERSAQVSVGAASAVALVTIPGTSSESFFEGGRVVEAIWLAATVLGLAIQPMSALPYIFGRLENGSGFDANEVGILTTLRARYLKLFKLGNNVAELLLFRIAKAGPLSVRSLRRPLEDMLSFE